jgi:hypothetical protein
MHLEFVVVGIPVSNQSTNAANLNAWKAKVKAEAQKVWKKPPPFRKVEGYPHQFPSG